MSQNIFPDTVSTLLKEGNTVRALSLFTDNKNSDEVFNNSWDLVPIVSHYLSDECENTNIEVFKCCQRLLDIIAEQSKAEEVLLQFIEEIELAKDDTKFLVLLKPLQTVLLRVPDKRITSLGWCFNAIKNYLQEVETPEDMVLIGDERLLLDTNESVNRINNLYSELLVFIETFVQELMKLDRLTRNVQERRQVLTKFLIDLMGKPLAFLDMDMYRNTKPKPRLVAEKLVKYFSNISWDPFLFLDLHDGDYGNDLIKPNDLSLGVLYYLVLSEDVHIEGAPKIYNPIYIFHNSLIFVNTLLTQDNQLVVEKGVHLVGALLKNIDHLELPYLLLDSEQHSKFCNAFSAVIVHNGNANIRKKALQILQNYLWSFEHQGRYLVIINLMRTLSHSGLKGNIITQYKEMITREIQVGSLKTTSRYYKGRKLFNLLDQFTLLRCQEKTDLVDESDQIVSTLNLLRYLIIVDKTNTTNIHSYLPSLEEGYFKHLKTGVQMSKEHYLQKVKEVDQEGETKIDCKVSVTVSGKNLIEMSKERKMQIMNLSLTTLDVIDSLLSRLIECINLNNVIV